MEKCVRVCWHPSQTRSTICTIIRNFGVHPPRACTKASSFISTQVTQRIILNHSHDLLTARNLRVRNLCNARTSIHCSTGEGQEASLTFKMCLTHGSKRKYAKPTARFNNGPTLSITMCRSPCLGRVAGQMMNETYVMYGSMQ